MPDSAVSAAAPGAAAVVPGVVPGVAPGVAPTVAPGDAPAAGAAPVDAGPKHKVKFDGKELEVPLDELIKGYQLETSARKRTQEAAAERKAAQAEREKYGKIGTALKAGDYNALKDAGLSDAEIEHLSVNVLSAKMQAQMEDERRKAMDPAQREVEDKLAERERLLADKSKVENEAKQAKVTSAKQAITKAVIDTMAEFPEAVRRNEALAQNVFESWAYCIEHPEEAKALGIEPSPKGIAKAVRKRHTEIARAMVESATEDEIPGMVPDSVAARILAKRKAAAEAAAHPSLTSEPQVRGAGTRQPPAPGKKQGALLRRLTLGSQGLK